MPTETITPNFSSNMHQLDTYVGSRIRLRRMAMSMSQEAVAAALGVSFQQIQKYERGSNRISASRLYALSYILSVSITFFFEGYDEVSANPLSIAEDHKLFKGEDTLKMSQKETLELIRAYYQIKDLSVRKKVIELMKTLSDPKIDILGATNEKNHGDSSKS
ncbi:MAG: hypothetical protein BGO28_06225 [Alphaproteobacteria bacterium 43-37]|nr:MAG: hypothetical protein BGO28_06225 [Alphaproteobacteria bacterium 43-37]